jgi:hypothetical protein
MDDSLILTFAELVFLVQPRSDAPTIVDRLGIKPDAVNDVISAAGLASLVARGLMTETDGSWTLTDRLTLVTAALSQGQTMTEMVTWTADRPVLVHVMSAPGVRVWLMPAAHGVFGVSPLDPAEPLTRIALRLFDRFAPGPQAALAIRSAPIGGAATGMTATTAGRSGDEDRPRWTDEVVAAVARDADGGWHLSDSLSTPEQSEPSTRAGVVERLTRLFDAGTRP